MGVKYHLLTEVAVEYNRLPKKAKQPVLETEETIEFHLFPWYYIERKEAVSNDPLMQFVMCILHSRTNAHLQHWMTASRSDHQALNFFYDEVVDILDNFVEAFQGEYGKLHDVIDGYVFPTGKPLDYFVALAKEIDLLRKESGFPQECWLQNIVDELRTLVSQTIYQLRELK